MAGKHASWHFAMALIGCGILSGGCVSAEQHRAALSDLQRLRMEAWQKSVEAAALRMALDRAGAENAALKAATMAPASNPEIQALSAKLDELARRQEVMAEDAKAAASCAQPPSSGATANAAGQTAPKTRKVTDLLYSRF